MMPRYGIDTVGHAMDTEGKRMLCIIRYDKTWYIAKIKISGYHSPGHVLFQDQCNEKIELIGYRKKIELIACEGSWVLIPFLFFPRKSLHELFDPSDDQFHLYNHWLSIYVTGPCCCANFGWLHRPAIWDAYSLWLHINPKRGILA